MFLTLLSFIDLYSKRIPKILLLVFVVFNHQLFSQFNKDDQISDILYLKNVDIDSTIIGKTIHIDFYYDSYGKQRGDTISLLVEKTPIPFVELRRDNDSTQIFSQQYLESSTRHEDLILRISSFKVINISEKILILSADIRYYDKSDIMYPIKVVTETFQIQRKTITKVLVKKENNNTLPYARKPSLDN